MTPATRTLGRTGLAVTDLCVGTSPLGSMPDLYGYEVDESRAVAAVRAVLESPIRFLDTSNGYGDGESERRIGRAIREAGGLPEGFVLATKVDPDPATGDFSGARVRASVAESLERLGQERFDLLYLHDPERIGFGEATGPGGAVEALIELRERGVVSHMGVAGGPIDLLLRYVETDVFDVVLTHNRYTLLNRSALPVIEAGRQRNLGVVNAAPYGGGMLAKGPVAQPNYAYGERGAELRSRVLRMETACRAHGVPLAAAALQFSLREERIHSTVVGVSSAERVAATLELAATDIPTALWEELEALTLAGVPGVD